MAVCMLFIEESFFVVLFDERGGEDPSSPCPMSHHSPHHTPKKPKEPKSKRHISKSKYTATRYTLHTWTHTHHDSAIMAHVWLINVLLMMISPHHPNPNTIPNTTPTTQLDQPQLIRYIRPSCVLRFTERHACEPAWRHETRAGRRRPGARYSTNKETRDPRPPSHHHPSSSERLIWTSNLGPSPDLQ